MLCDLFSFIFYLGFAKKRFTQQSCTCTVHAEDVVEDKEGSIFNRTDDDQQKQDMILILILFKNSSCGWYLIRPELCCCYVFGWCNPLLLAFLDLESWKEMISKSFWRKGRINSKVYVFSTWKASTTTSWQKFNTVQIRDIKWINKIKFNVCSMWTCLYDDTYVRKWFDVGKFPCIVSPFGKIIFAELNLCPVITSYVL